MPTAGFKFYHIEELLRMTCGYLGHADLCAMAVLTRRDWERFSPNVWADLRGFENLLAVLDDSLRVRATGPAVTTIKIPQPETFNPQRVQRFLLYASYVMRLEVYADPHERTRWHHLNRLSSLLQQAPDEREVLMPWVTEAYITTDGAPLQAFAPLVRLFANPTLRTLQIQGVAALSYPQSSPGDTVEMMNLLARAQDLETPQLTTIDIFPAESRNLDDERLSTFDAFAPLISQLTRLSVSTWFLSPQSFRAIALAPIARLQIRGASNSAPSGFPWPQHAEEEEEENPFGHLRTLLLETVPSDQLDQLLSVPRLLDHVVSLRIDVCPVIDPENPEDPAVYVRALRRAGEAPNLKNLILSPREPEWFDPYVVPVGVLESLAERSLDTLRLYHVRLVGTVGFQFFRRPGFSNLRHLSIIRQDITPEDLVAFSRLPRLTRLGANVSVALGEPRLDLSPAGFTTRLELTSGCMFGAQYSGRASQRRVIARIAR
ncbi:hypothetical protein FRC08_006894 [Ceratobasidium sp. 394]|nr:hypothetical protein FRC08_006894 [Ceratobasidium sp. 394]